MRIATFGASGATRVVRTVDGRLAAKGLTKVDPRANPDLLVAYHASFDRNLQVDVAAFRRADGRRR